MILAKTLLARKALEPTKPAHSCHLIRVKQAPTRDLRPHTAPSHARKVWAIFRVSELIRVTRVTRVRVIRVKGGLGLLGFYPP